MKTITEFAGPTLKTAIETRQRLIGEGKTEADLPQALGEAMKVEGDRLTLLTKALAVVEGKLGDLKRVIVFTLGEGERAPSKSVEKEGHFLLAEYYPSIATHNAGRKFPGKRPGKHGKHRSRHGRRGREGDRAGGPGGGAPREAQGGAGGPGGGAPREAQGGAGGPGGEKSGERRDRRPWKNKPRGPRPEGGPKTERVPGGPKPEAGSKPRLPVPNNTQQKAGKPEQKPDTATAAASGETPSTPTQS